MTIVNLLTTGSVMMFIWNVDRPGPGLKQMALGDLLIGFGLLTLSLKNIVPAGMVLLLSNLAIVAGAMSMWNGVRAFRGIPSVSGVISGGTILAYGAMMSYWIFADNNYSLRIAFGSIVAGVICVFMMSAMFTATPREDRQLYYFSGTLFGLHAISLVTRALWALTHSHDPSLLTGTAADVSAIFTLNFVITGCCLAVATASSRKLYHSTRKLALHDPLTQLPNRRMFEDRLDELASLEVRPFVALIYLDLDNFKVVNENFGHRGGDQALRIVGERMLAQKPDNGFPARLGGDEFVILVEQPKSRTEVLATMTALIGAVKKEMVISEKSISLEVSGGIALFPEDAASLAELLDIADRSMYRAKRRHRQFPRLTPPLQGPQFVRNSQ
jgi:diguanylate cyclase (GGDEF)-like protein